MKNKKHIYLILFILIILIFIFTLNYVSTFVFFNLVQLTTGDIKITSLYDYYIFYKDDAYIVQKITNSIFIAFVVCLSPLALFFFTKQKSLFGDAKFATFGEIKKMGLLDGKGIIIGKIERAGKTFYLRITNVLHILMSAPTRSGKGVGIVIPNLLSWSESAIVLDIKQENWDITSGYRTKNGNECYLINFAPRDYKSHGWNPFFYISEDPAFRINDVQNIGQMLFPSNDKEAPIWQSSSRSLWLGVSLYLLETKELTASLGEVLRQVVQDDDEFASIVEERQSGDNPLSKQCYSSLNEYFTTPEKTRGSVKKGFLSSLELLYNPIIDKVTSHNSFDLRDLRRKKMTIYVAVTANDLGRLQPLINLFFQQAIDANIRILPEQDKTLKYKCLLLMDEFTAMGVVKVLSDAISFIAGYNLIMLPIIQSHAQLRDKYGADNAETFIDNHAYQIIFPPKNIKIAKDISETLGTQTVKNKSQGRSGVSMGKQSMSSNVSSSSRALMLPQELIQLDRKKSIILVEGLKPILCDKITWYNDPFFMNKGNGRSKINFPAPIIPLIKIDMNENKKTTKNKNKINADRSIENVDFENIDNIDLKDFNYDFSKISIPEGELTNEQLENVKNNFLEQCC